MLESVVCCLSVLSMFESVVCCLSVLCLSLWSAV